MTEIQRGITDKEGKTNASGAQKVQEIFFSIVICLLNIVRKLCVAHAVWLNTIQPNLLYQRLLGRKVLS